MSGSAIHLKIKINFPVIFFTVLSLHLLAFTLNQLPELAAVQKPEEPTALKIRRIKTAKKTEGFLKTDTFLPHKQAAASESPGPLNLKDLAINKMPQPKVVTQAPPSVRPGSRPETPKAINSISLKGQEFKEYSQGQPSGGLSLREKSFGGAGLNDAVVSLEVPEGVEIDELNKYELMFYSFQRRTALNYASSIIRNLDKFRRENPHFKFDPNSNIIMTARLTYDEKGNVKQIKMIRWTHMDKVQNFFEDVVKGIDQLHNPPKALWEKSGEFAMFFTLEING